MLLPATPAAATFTLEWDLSALPANARGVTVHSEGSLTKDFENQFEIGILFLLGGNVKGHRHPGQNFHTYWIGEPPFNVPAATEWCQRTFSALGDQFNDPAPGPYTLLMRPYPRARDGGGATTGGFMLEYGTGYMSDDSRRIMFAHEMVHHFLGVLDGWNSADAWYGEGLAEFYKIRTCAAAGLLSTEALAYEIAVVTQAYYTSPVVNLSMEEAGAKRWADREIQGIPYNRGFIYFVDLDARIRTASGGRRNLDNLILAMLASRRLGGPYNETLWRTLLTAELGQEGVRHFERMLSGELIIPPEDAFEPVLGQGYGRVHLFQPRRALGFSEDAFLSKPAIVENLSPTLRRRGQDSERATKWSPQRESGPGSPTAHRTSIWMRWSKSRYGVLVGPPTRSCSVLKAMMSTSTAGWSFETTNATRASPDVAHRLGWRGSSAKLVSTTIWH